MGLAGLPSQASATEWVKAPVARTGVRSKRRRAFGLSTGLEIKVPLFIKEGEKIKVHTETREFAGRA